MDSEHGISRRQARTRVALRIIYSIVAPWLLFCGVYTASAHSLHHYWPALTWTVVICSWIFVWFNFIMMNAAIKQNHRWEARWQGFNTACLAFSIILGTYFGNKHYNTLWKKYYDFKALEAYVNVNPNSDSGTGFMDAGQVYFKEGSHIDTTRAVAFHNYNTFCVAPIIREILQEEGDTHKTGDTGGIKLPKSGSVDFFAVGVNCCDPNGFGFNCGDASNGLARSGLRVLEESDRAFYDMAVVMWSNRYNIPTKHPLFFKWTTNPLTEVLGMEFTANIKYQQQVMMQLIWNICVTSIVVIFFDFGKYSSK